MKVLKDFLPAHLGRTVIFLLAVVFLLVTGVIHTDIYAADNIMMPIPTGEGVVVNRTNLNFGMVTGHGSPYSQVFTIRQDVYFPLKWRASSDKDWLICSCDNYSYLYFL